MSAPFVQVRQKLHDQKVLFVDEEFKADPKSLYPSKSHKSDTKFEWKRASDLLNKNKEQPKFVIDDIAKFDLVPGKYGNQSITSALSILCQYRGLFYRAVPADQGFAQDFSYSGIFHFRFWWAGEWVEVLIDDDLPTVNGQLVFTHSHSNSQLWPALLEKAYAKLHGSYEALNYTTAGELLSELSGGVTETIPIKDMKMNHLIDLLQTTVSTTTIITAQTSADIKPENSHHLLAARCYNLLQVDRVHSIDGASSTVLFRFQQCPGAVPVTGPWCLITQGKWLQTQITDSIKTAASAGCFWLSVSEFEHHFSTIQLVHFDGDTCHSEPKLRQLEPLQTRVVQSAWCRAVTAGGCRNHIDTFHINPQFAITVLEPCDVIISVIQHRARNAHVIGFSLYSAPKEFDSKNRLDAAFFRLNKAIFHSVYTNQKQVVHRVNVSAGTYILVPSTYETSHESAFTVRLYATVPLSFGLLDTTPTIERAPIVKAPDESNDYKEMFHSFSDEKRSVNSYELQELLHACLPNDYMKSSASLEVCRKVVLAFQRHTAGGRIEYKQFKDFIHSLKIWQEVFSVYSGKTSGVMKAEQLRDALNDVGFTLNTDILQIVMLRYMRRDGTLRFGDFVACILQLIAVFNTFQRKDAAKSGLIKMNSTEVEL